MDYNNILSELKFKNFLDQEYIEKKKIELFAHIDGKISDKEYLESHILLCNKYFLELVKNKNLENIFENFQKIFFKNPDEILINDFKIMITSVILLHDIGKVNPVFQKKRMKNDILSKEISYLTNHEHSFFSALVYINEYTEAIIQKYKNQIPNNPDVQALLYISIINSHIISRHHSGLGNFDEYIEKLNKIIIDENPAQYKDTEWNFLIEPFLKNKFRISENKFKTITKVINQYKKTNLDIDLSIAYYTYERLILSILIACDYYATNEYMNGFVTKEFGDIGDIDFFKQAYKESQIYKSIREYQIKQDADRICELKNVNDINIMRTELFLEAEKNLLKNNSVDVYYLEAPTGSGKSNTANNLAFNIMENDKSKNKIFYIYPFNTLVEQNIDIFKTLYKEKPEVLNKIAVINSLNAIKKEESIVSSEDNTYEIYQKALLDRQFLNYPLILTTHVSIFKFLFSSGREDIFPMHQICNSVIIFDEIQSYKNTIWSEIIEFISRYAKLLNIKFIIMSATLPNLDLLVSGNTNSIKLIENREKYFENKIFKNRVNIDYSMLDLEIENLYTNLIEKINNYKTKKVLVEFINKNRAYEFFKILNEEINDDRELYLLTGDDNLIERKSVIDRVKEGESAVLIATQVIEAGVDIDMDIGFKDISILDSEEQFLGRINRSCKKKDSKVYFFNRDKAGNIYKNDLRRQDSLTLDSLKMRKILEDKDFQNYYEQVIKLIEDFRSQANTNNTKDFFIKNVGNLEFKSVQEKMKLIEDDNNKVSLFINREYIDEKGTIVRGNEVWDKYKELLENNDMDYSERIVKLSAVKALANNFIYKIALKYNINYDGRIGDILYLENGEQYFENGKLKRDKFESDEGDFI